jgi:hypothetical protein
MYRGIEYFVVTTGIILLKIWGSIFCLKLELQMGQQLYYIKSWRLLNKWQEKIGYLKFNVKVSKCMLYKKDNFISPRCQHMEAINRNIFQWRIRSISMAIAELR